MKPIFHALRLILPLVLTACVSIPTLNRARVPGGERFTLPDHHVALTLPDDGWEVCPVVPSETLFVAETDHHHLRFVLTKPHEGFGHLRVADPAFQKITQNALREEGFTRITRSTVIQVDGHDALLCAASKSGQPESVLVVILVHQGRLHCLAFRSTHKPLAEIPATQTIIDSFRFLP